jgi:hypothetical protein
MKIIRPQPPKPPLPDRHRVAAIALFVMLTIATAAALLLAAHLLMNSNAS